MNHLWLILLVISSIWGQSLNFINKDATIIVKPGQLINLNGVRYTLINTDYDKQQIILETEIPDSAPYKYLREPIEGGFLFVSILKFPNICNISFGSVTPIPTFPIFVILILSVVVSFADPPVCVSNVKNPEKKFSDVAVLSLLNPLMRAIECFESLCQFATNLIAVPF